jgi:hypothetical protein
MEVVAIKIFKMKRLLLLTFCLLAATLVIAQTPFQFNFQAVARDLAGNPMVNQTVDFRLSILEGSENGPAVFAEDQNVMTNNFGLANLLVGTGTPLNGTLDAIDWALGPFFLQIELDIDNGQGLQLMGVSPMTSVPYALHALTSEEEGPQGPQGPQGEAGPQGDPGETGLSAYEIWLDLGNTGSEQDFIDSLIAAAAGTGDGSGDCRGCVQEVSALQTSMTLPNCIDHCLASSENGETDWRMPTLEEVSFYRTVLDLDETWNNAWTWTSSSIATNGFYRISIVNEHNLSNAGADTTFDPTYGCRCVR